MLSADVLCFNFRYLHISLDFFCFVFNTYLLKLFFFQHISEFIFYLFFIVFFISLNLHANSMDPDQTAPSGAV